MKASYDCQLIFCYFLSFSFRHLGPVILVMFTFLPTSNILRITGIPRQKNSFPRKILHRLSGSGSKIKKAELTKVNPSAARLSYCYKIRGFPYLPHERVGFIEIISWLPLPQAKLPVKLKF